ncbi:MAG TPA: bifunctional aspartate kinase/homoserine dehydrogenase I [Gemmatimonadales bacterium]|nr:bifunctional aspartate kinase/homoserine dehydrogenase I [Gemmatimonadales bacterium]
MPPRNRRAPEVHKFGGASLADSTAVRHAVDIIHRVSATPIVVVASAMAGVTDALLEVARQAGGGNQRTVASLVGQLRARHVEVARAILPAGRSRTQILAHINQVFQELEDLAQGLRLVGELTPRTTDSLLSRGERLSARLLVAALDQAGTRAKYVDALEVVHTDSSFGHASPDLVRTDRGAQRVLAPLLQRRIIPVVPGFLGATPAGQLATLGRGGSDLTATLLARALDATHVSLWKDVPGLLTADPRIVSDARVIPQLHVREAAELAYYGAKVLHPRALIPVSGRRISIHIRPFADPGSPGTEVSERAEPGRFPVKALTAAGGQALLTVTGNGMLGVPGIAARTFAALHGRQISVSLISQASSEHSICFSVPEPFAETARQSLTREFQGEITRGEIDGVEVDPGMATIAIVGLGMHGTPGVAAGVFSALAAGGINVVAIAQGSSELNISVVVASKDAAEAQRRIHAAFQLSRIAGGAVVQPERMELVLLGFGQIGRALATLIGQVKRPALSLRIVGIIDRSGFVFESQGLSPRQLAALSAAKQEGKGLAGTPEGHAATPPEAVEHITRHALTRPVLVDLTADDTAPVLEQALIQGLDLVLANKRPLADSRSVSEALWQAARVRGRRILHEATVGAGLPIIDTYRKLVESGDRVERIEGLLSGTLGFVFSEVSAGIPFSQAVRTAMKRGFTEPDPREDLSGMDVARKALILARLMGYPGELSRNAVQSLVPRWARDLTLPEFLSRLKEIDPVWQRRASHAAAAGSVLRYVAVVTRSKFAVGVRAVAGSSPFAGIKGSDNQLVFTTTRYKSNPLVITGPGAGAEVTAAGVLNDILRLAGA